MRTAFALPSRSTLLAAGAALAALAFLALIAWWGAVTIENRTVAAIKSRLLGDGITWAEVSADGLAIDLTGTAPNEAARFRAVNLAGGIVSTGRIRDRLEVTALRAIEAPRFSIEVLRNADGVSLIGLLPGDGDADDNALAADVAALAGGLPVADMLETADYPAPEGWQAAMEFGLKALQRLPRSKISIAADRVTVTAISDSVDEKRKLETELSRLVPEGLAVGIDISAPRPVLTPFTLRFVKDEGGARFDACAADTDRARARILAAGAAAGVEGKVACTVGLGVPSPSWSEAAEAAIRAVATLGAATVTFSDADVTLLAAPEVEQALFDRVVGDLQATLPPVFSLTATLQPRAVQTVQGPAEFTATLSPEGKVELRGRLSDELQRNAVDSFARAFFGADAVYTATRLDPDLPDGWPVRVLAGIEALSSVEEGSLLVRPDLVEVTGVSGDDGASARISQVLSGKLGPGQTFKVDVRYDEARDPDKALPTPEECAARLNAVVAAQKITFTPGSAEIDGSARNVIDALAAVLKDCPGLRIEIAGHTDSQGSEGGNQALSQARAEAVLVALQGRRLPVEGFEARGYGEAMPISDNGSEEGREANRRIEFNLIPAPGVSAATGPVATTAPAAAMAALPNETGTGASSPAAPAVAASPGDLAWTPDDDDVPAAARPRARPGDAAPADNVSVARADGSAEDAAAVPDGGDGTLATDGDDAMAADTIAPTDAGSDSTLSTAGDPDGGTIEIAAAEVDPQNGATRGITLPALAEDAVPATAATESGVVMFVPTEDRSIRPPRRPSMLTPAP